MGLRVKQRWGWLAFAVAFAVAVTGVWFWKAPTFSDAIGSALWHFYLVVNFGGACLEGLVQGYLTHGTMASPESGPIVAGNAYEGGPSSAWFVGTGWVWSAAAAFVGALLQGLVYAAIGSAILRRRRRRNPEEQRSASTA